MSLVWTLLFAALLQGTPAPRLLDKGDQSNLDEPRHVALRTAQEWNTLWRQHAADRSQPSVDFGREMVVGVFLGTRNTAGYAVEIVGATVEQGVLVVRHREVRPLKGGIVAQVITSPYHIVAVPRHAGEVKFQEVRS